MTAYEARKQVGKKQLLYLDELIYKKIDEGILNFKIPKEMGIIAEEVLKELAANGYDITTYTLFGRKLFTEISCERGLEKDGEIKIIDITGLNTDKIFNSKSENNNTTEKISEDKAEEKPEDVLNKTKDEFEKSCRQVAEELNNSIEGLLGAILDPSIINDFYK